MKVLAFLPLAVVSVLAGPVDTRQPFAPVVTTLNGRVIGKSDSGIESFSGLPYAKPPVGQLRLKPPQAYTGSYPGGTLDGTGTAMACPQQGQGLNLTLVPRNVTDTLSSFFSKAISNASEDCLTLDIQRPSTTPTNAKLPVLLWFYGGGFEAGASQSYDASQILMAGINGAAKGHPFVFVTPNYRMSAFGFLAGRELQQDGSTNLGLRDQRLALQWVADNIAAFGGDPARVTIWGESAGAMSVLDQMLVNNGNHTYKGKPLFKAAIMNSGSIFPADQVDTPKPRSIYKSVVHAAGCSSAKDTLACLRTLPYATFKAASDSVPFIGSYRSIDLSYLPRPDRSSSFFSTSPEEALLAGRYAKVPLIIGDQEDEGTIFALAQGNTTTSDELVAFLKSIYSVTGTNLVSDLVANYPNDPTAGSPFRTGNLNNVYPQFKRLAAILGDISFTMYRRIFLHLVPDSLPRWSFIDSHLHDTAVLATFHANDIFSNFYGTGTPNVVDTYRNAVISMVYYDDPNKIVNLNWPQWKADNTTGRRLLNIDATANSVIKDDFRDNAAQFLYKNLGKIRL